jgi:hypothetical protein
LLAFPFIEIDATLEPADGVFIKTVSDDFIRGEVLFDVKFKDGIKDIVGRERVLIGLVRTKFSAWGFVDGVPGDDFGVAIDPTRDLIDACFREIRNGSEAAAHVAVDGAVSDREFAFVSGGEQEVVFLIGEGHEKEAADAGLHILLGEILGFIAEDREHGGFHGIKHPADRDFLAADAEIFSESKRVIHTASGGKRARHGEAMDIFRS